MSRVFLQTTNRLVSVFTFVLTFAAMTQTAVGAERRDLKEFLEITGFDVALDSIALNAVDAPRMLGMSSSDFTSAWTQTTRDVFAREKLHALAYEILSEILSDELRHHVMAFYGSDLGRRLVLAENASHMFDDYDAKQGQGQALFAAAADQRVAALNRLAVAVDSTGAGVSAVQEIQMRFLMAASQAGVLEYKLDETVLRTLMKEREAELRESMRMLNLHNSAYSYRDFSDDEIIAYAEALEHPQMQQVYQLMNAIIFEVTAQRFEELAVRMAGLQSGESL